MPHLHSFGDGSLLCSLRCKKDVHNTIIMEYTISDVANKLSTSIKVVR